MVVCCCGGLTISCGVTSLCCAGVCAGLTPGAALTLTAGLTGVAAGAAGGDAAFALFPGALLWFTCAPAAPIRAPCWTSADTDVPFPFCSMLAMM